MKMLSLAKATIRGTTWISSDGLRELARKDRLWLLPLIGLGLLVGIGMVVFMTVGVYRSILAAGTALGHPEMVLFYALLGSWAFLFLTAVPLGLSVLYYSSDLRLLLVLPISPVRIVSAKAVLLYFYCLPVNLLLLVPALWLYIAQVGASASIVVATVASLLIQPILPLSLATLLVLGLMKVVNLSRYRVALEVAGMAVAVFLLVGLQMTLSRATFSLMQGGSMQSLSGFPDFYAAISRALPPVAWASGSFAPGAGLLPLLGSLAVTAVVTGVVLLLAPVGFLHDVMERREAGARRRHGARAGAALSLAPRGILRGLIAREWAILSSNSTFIFEAVGELLVLPLLLAIYGFVIPKEILGQALTFIERMPSLGLALMGVAVLMTSITTVSSTSISREGKRFGLSLTIPVAGSVQVRAKLWFHLFFFSSAYLVDLAILWVLFRYPLVSLSYMIPGGIALQIVSFAIAIFFDLKRPILSWTHPQQAMKNNMNAMSGIGCTAGVVALLGLPAALLALRGVSPLLIGGAVAAVAVVLAVVLLGRVMAFADRQYGGGLEL